MGGFLDKPEEKLIEIAILKSDSTLIVVVDSIELIKDSFKGTVLNSCKAWKKGYNENDWIGHNSSLNRLHN